VRQDAGSQPDSGDSCINSLSWNLNAFHKEYFNTSYTRPRTVEFPVAQPIKYPKSTQAHWDHDYSTWPQGDNPQANMSGTYHVWSLQDWSWSGSQWVEMDGRWGHLSAHCRLHVHFTLSAITLYNLMYFLKNKLILMYSFNMLINKETNIDMSLVLHSSGLPESLPPPPCLK
jgi:hypothetical protein